MRNLLCLFFVGILFTGCGKEPLDQVPVDNVTDNTFFQSESDYQMAVNGVYGKHADFITFINQLDAAYLEVNETTEYSSIREKTYTGNDPLISKLWENAYSILREIHDMLELLDESPILSDNFRNIATAQLLAARGYINMQLALWYGKAPLVLKKLTPSDNWNIPASNRNKLLDEAIADFEVALLYYADSEYTYMRKEQIRKNLIQAYALKGEITKAASLLDNEDISGDSFCTALNLWFSGEEKEKVMDVYKSSYSVNDNPAAKLLLNVMEYDQVYFGWPDSHLAVLPIPERELHLNPALTPNPGY